MKTNLKKEDIIIQLEVWNVERLASNNAPRIQKHYYKMLKEIKIIINKLLKT